VPVCENCGAFVTATFVRVFGDNGGDVYGCYQCESASELVGGASRQNGP